MKKLLFILLSACAIFGQVGVDFAVDFSVTDIDGKTYKLFNLLDQNKYVMIDVWNSH